MVALSPFFQSLSQGLGDVPNGKSYIHNNSDLPVYWVHYDIIFARKERPAKRRARIRDQRILCGLGLAAPTAGAVAAAASATAALKVGVVDRETGAFEGLYVVDL